MAISRLNYTGRKRISRKDVRLTVHDLPDGTVTFDADLRLKDYKLPEEALVFVEAYRQTRWMRFPYGRVGALVAPVDRKLTEFDSADGILFRVRDTSSADRHGVMLAEADKISIGRPEVADEDRSPLLPVQSADLGQEVYQLDFSNGPKLLIAKSLDKQAVSSSWMFRSLVCSSAMREILTRILFREDFPDLEDRDDWKARWILFARSLPGVDDLQDQDDEDRKEDWIDQAVSSFARQQRLLDHFSSYWQGEEIR